MDKGLKDVLSDEKLKNEIRKKSFDVLCNKKMYETEEISTEELKHQFDDIYFEDVDSKREYYCWVSVV